MEEWDLGDYVKFPQLELRKYLKKVYYEESDVTRLEPMKWVVEVECAVLLNMLWVQHFSRIMLGWGPLGSILGQNPKFCCINM